MFFAQLFYTSVGNGKGIANPPGNLVRDWKYGLTVKSCKTGATWRAPLTHPVVATLDHPLFRCAGKRAFCMQDICFKQAPIW